MGFACSWVVVCSVVSVLAFIVAIIIDCWEMPLWRLCAALLMFFSSAGYVFSMDASDVNIQPIFCFISIALVTSAKAVADKDGVRSVQSGAVALVGVFCKLVS